MFNNTSKFLVLASAQRANLHNDLNMRRHVDAQFSLIAQGFKHECVLGHYKELGQHNGNHELSFAIPCKTAKQIKALAKLFCDCFQQDCILVWNKDSDNVWLVDKTGCAFTSLGKMHMAHDEPDVECWTYNGGFYYYAE